MKKSYYAIHEDLLDEIIIALQKVFKDIRLYKNVTGDFYTKRGTYVKVGKKGEPDLYGHIGPFMIFIEVKAGKKGIIKNSEQYLFQQKCKRMKILHFVGRDKNKIIKEVIEELKNKTDYYDGYVLDLRERLKNME